jgi:hypothetical protein
MLYQELLIWRRHGEKTAIRYVCLMNMATRKYSVQSVDFYRLPLSHESLTNFQKQFVQLFCESDPGERAGAFDSLEEAIAAHHQDFGPPGSQ